MPSKPFAKPIPPLRLLAGIALLVLPVLAGFVLLLVQGAGSAGWALVGALSVLTGGALVYVATRREVAALADHVAGLADRDGESRLEGRISPPARRIAAVAARLHRAMLQKVQRAQAQLDANDAIFDALHDPLLLVDAGRQVTRANLAARSLFGERVLNRDLASSLRNPKVLEAVDAVLRGAASRVVEFTLPVPVERMFEAQVKPFQGRPDIMDPADQGTHQNEPVRMAILALHDMTAARRSEQMRADFIANASHELRTPLSSLMGFIETLRGPARDDAEAQDRFLSIMHDQASRMTRLVNDLLSLSRIELDEHMPPADRVDVLEQVENVIAELELKAESRRIGLRLEASGPIPPVMGDEDQLTQVFQNLVSNAIKYTRADTEVTIAVSLADGSLVGFAGGQPGPRRGGRSTAMVAVAVRDQGEGIARIHLPRLTERFYRVDAARSRALGGTGLGLAIVKHILNRHRGRLTIESEVGVGSTFTVYLPAAEEKADGGAVRRAG